MNINMNMSEQNSHRADMGKATKSIYLETTLWDTWIGVETNIPKRKKYCALEHEGENTNIDFKMTKDYPKNSKNRDGYTGIKESVCV